jgi:hypothetical protein
MKLLFASLAVSLILIIALSAETMPIANRDMQPLMVSYPIPFVPSQILIKPLDNVSLEGILTLNTHYGASMTMVGRSLGIYRLDFPLPATREEVEVAYEQGLADQLEHYRQLAMEHVYAMIAAYEASGLVEWAAPNHYASIFYTPNDPYFRDATSFPNTTPDQHGLWRTQPNGGCDARTGWDYTTGNSSIIIGNTDSGLNLDDPDIQGNLWTNSGEVPNNNIDDDGNGYIDDVHGYDFVGDWVGDLWGTPNEDPDPDVYYPDPACGNGVDDDLLDGVADAGVGHGTMTSGCAAAEMDNSISGTGACGHAQIVMARGINPEGGGTDATIAGGIDYLTTVGVDVINLSLGSTSSMAATETAVINAYNSGIAVICASGNSGDNTTMYPASLTQALAVGSANTSNTRAYFSTYGTWLDVMAPGGEVDQWPNPTQIQEAIWATYVASVADTAQGLIPGNAYVAGGVGTSFACPHTVGLAAMIKYLNPSYSPTQIYNKLTSTAYDLPPAGFDQETGYGRVDFGQALAGIAEEIQEPVHSLFAIWVAPNPSRGHIVFSSNASPSAVVTFTINDMSGRHIATLTTEGARGMTWNLLDSAGQKVANGIYFVSARCGTEHTMEKVTILK